MKSSWLFLAVAFAVIGCARQEDPKHIIFAAKAFYDSAQTSGDAMVYVAGTMAGEGIQYKNNSVAVSCYKDRMECLTYSVEQIGQNQISRLDSPVTYPVIKWDPSEIVAADFDGLQECRKTTISIIRKSASLVWVVEPINQSRASCKNAGTRFLKWSIEDSPG